MNNTYVFLGNLIPFLRKEDLQLFDDYKLRLAKENLDIYIDSLVDIKDVDYSKKICSTLKYSINKISYYYDFFEWGFIEHTHELCTDIYNTHIYSYYKCA